MFVPMNRLRTYIGLLFLGSLLLLAPCKMRWALQSSLDQLPTAVAAKAKGLSCAKTEQKSENRLLQWGQTIVKLKKIGPKPLSSASLFFLSQMKRKNRAMLDAEGPRGPPRPYFLLYQQWKNELMNAWQLSDSFIKKTHFYVKSISSFAPGWAAVSFL